MTRAWFLLVLLGLAARQVCGHDQLAARYPGRGHIFENDCFIQALQFERDFRQAHPEERTRRIIVAVGSERKHSATLFTFQGRLHFWDQAHGVVALDLPADLLDARPAERRAQQRYDERMRAARARRLPRPSERFPQSRGEQIAYMRHVQRTFPAMAAASLHSVLTSRGEKFFLVLLMDGLFTAYTPGSGTALVPLTREIAEDERLEREQRILALCASRMFGAVPVVTFIPAVDEDAEALAPT